MSSSSISSSAAVATDALLVRDVDGQYRPALADEVLSHARRVLARRVRRGATLSSPQAVKDHLRLEIGALEHGVDLTRSTMAAYHDGGERDGQFYDSDFGGPLYAGGDEGLVLPDLDPSLHKVAKAKAEAIFSRAR